MKPLHVLLIEDNPGDADLTCDSLGESGLRLDVSVAIDGEDALNYLFRRGKYAHVGRPDLILLDLNLPKMDGRTVLAELRRDEHLRLVPVVILTTSDAERDIVQSYSLGANCYVTKPVDLKAFQSIVQSIENFWLTVAKLP